MPRSFACCCLLLVLLANTLAWGRMQPVPKRRIGTPPPVVLKALLKANQQAAAIPKGAPLVTWLVPPDERLTAAALFGAGSGGIYQVRTTGPLFLTDLAAVDFGVRALYTPVLLITGNTDDRLLAELLVEPPLETDLARTADMLRAAVPANAVDSRAQIEGLIDRQVALAVHRYRDRIRIGRLVVVGAVADLANSYGQGKGRLIIININGETDPDQLRRSPLLRTIGPKLASSIGRRPGTPAKPPSPSPSTSRPPNKQTAAPKGRMRP